MGAKQKGRQLPRIHSVLDIILLRDELCLETVGRDTRCPDPGFKEITQRYQLVVITLNVSWSLK